MQPVLLLLRALDLDPAVLRGPLSRRAGNTTGLAKSMALSKGYFLLGLWRHRFGLGSRLRRPCTMVTMTTVPNHTDGQQQEQRK